MSAHDAGETAVSPSGQRADPPPVPPARPSWEAAAPARRPDAAPCPAPSEAPHPYYAAAPPSTPSVPPAAPTPLDEAVQYDLAGNPVLGSRSSGYASPGQAAYAPAQAGGAPGVWPPQPTTPYGAAGGGQFSENGTDRVARLKWNWGAFLLPFWWCCFNGQRNLAWIVFAINASGRYIPAPLNYLLSVADLGIRIYLGAMGHRLSWAGGSAMGDYDGFIRTQRAWMIWGFVVNIILVTAAVAFFELLGSMSYPPGGGSGHTGGGFGHTGGGFGHTIP